MVTGGLGFIGRNLVARLLEEGAKVTVVEKAGVDARELTKIPSYSEGSLQFFQTDILDQKAVESYLQGQEIVFNLAGHSGPLGSLEEPFTDLEINCQLALNLLEATRKISPRARVIFPSTRLVYGRPKQLPVDEHHPTDPITIYGVHKLAAEGYHRIYYQSYNLETVILRISNPFGPHKPASHHLYNIFNWFIDRAMQGEVLNIFEKGNQQRDYVYIEDLVEAFLLAATRKEAVGEIFNIGGKPIRFVDMAKKIVEIVGMGSIKHVSWPDDYRTVETGDYVSKINKAREVFGWSPKIPLEEGIRRTIEAFEDNRSTLGQLLRL